MEQSEKWTSASEASVVSKDEFLIQAATTPEPIPGDVFVDTTIPFLVHHQGAPAPTLTTPKTPTTTLTQSQLLVTCPAMHQFP